MEKNKIKIMIVEDDPLICQLYQEILQKKGFDVIAVCSDGAQAVSQYLDLESKPDIILLDFRLPKKNGLEVSKEILANSCATEILMVTGDPTFDQKAILGSGISYMKKPVPVHELLQELSIIGKV